MKQPIRLSTHYLAIFSALFCSAMGWVLADPAHLKTVNDFTHGHAALASAFSFLVMLFNLLHNPRTMKMLEDFIGAVPEAEPSTPASERETQYQYPPRKPPQPVQYASAEALPQPPEPDQG